MLTGGGEPQRAQERDAQRVVRHPAGFAGPTLIQSQTRPPGRAMFQMMGLFAEFEWAMIRERVFAGLARAKEQGVGLGRRRLEDSDSAKVAAPRPQPTIVVSRQSAWTWLNSIQSAKRP